MIEIKVVKNKRMLKKFINYPVELYKDCPYFTPYLYSDEIENLTEKKNPASKYCIFRLFLAYKDNKIVGRICGIINNYANQKYNQKRVRFNRIDMIDDIEVTKALIKAVEDFGKEYGMEEINGPLGYSDQDKEGLLTKGFEEHNMFVTFYTHEYYVRHLETLGFKVDATWNEYQVFIPEKIDDRMVRMADLIAKRYKLRLVKFKNKKGLKKYVVSCLSLMNVCYKDLYGYVQIDEKQMHHLAAQYVPLINLDYIQIVVNEKDEVIAFGFMLPTPVFALKKHKGHLFPFGFIDFIKATKKEKILDMLLVAVDPEYQSKGVTSIIFVDALTNAIKNGVKYAETGPELEYNSNVQNLWKGFERKHHKTRSAFLKQIEK